MQWVVSLLFSVAAWLSLLFYRSGLKQLSPTPIQDEVITILLPGFSFADIPTWKIVWILLAFLVAIILTMPARFQAPTWDRWALILAFFAGLSGSVLSANLMTGLLMLTFVEGFILWVSSRWGPLDQRSILRHCVSRLFVICMLVISGAFMLDEVAGFPGGSIKILADISFTASNLLLIGLPSLAIPAARKGHLDDDFAWLFQSSPAILGLTFLGRAFPSLATQSMNWILLVGLLGFCYALLRWISDQEPGKQYSFVPLGITAISLILATSLKAGDAGAGILATTAALVIIVGYLGMLRNFSWMYRVFFALVVLILCGLPGFPGQGWLVMGSITGENWLRLGIGGIAMIVFSALLWLRSEQDISRWHTEETLAKLTYWLGIGLPIIAWMAAWFLEMPQISGMSLIIPAGLCGSSTGLAFLMRRAPARARFELIRHRLNLTKHLQSKHPNPMRWIADAIRWSASVFEGEAGMIWVLVVLQAVLLALLREGI